MTRTKPRSAPPAKRAVRCAIYTRKSTEDGLEQEFNSLDAQRDAGENYIRSQVHEGWEIVPDHYDDGGFTGGNMDRPALRRLMADIRFVHMMEHPQFDGVVEAGCVCAEKMSGDYVTPRLQEGRLRKKASRKARWLSRKWRTSHKGNHYLNVDGLNLVVFPAKFKPGRWCFSVDGVFSRATYATHDEAKLALFEEFWERLAD